MGIKPSLQWSTEDLTYQIAVDNFFKIGFKKNLIYEGKYLQSYCLQCGDYVSDCELSLEKKDKKMYSIFFQLKDGSKIKVLTTKPVYVYNVVCIIVASDSEYAKYNGQFAELKSIDIKIPIIIDDEYIKKDMGNVQMVCAFGSPTDYEIIKKYNLSYNNYLDLENKNFFG